MLFLGLSLGYLLGILTTFYALFLTVDRFLIPAIYVLKDRLRLTDDQTGALTSFVSSAPELSVSLISLLLAIRAEDAAQFREIAALGPSAVIGSALFSVLFIVGAASWYSTKTLTWHSITRDMGYYIFAVLVLFFCLQDTLITWIEATVLLALYLVYVGLVARWPQITRLLKLHRKTPEPAPALDSSAPASVPPQDLPTRLLSKLFFGLTGEFKAGKITWNLLFSTVLVVVSSYYMVELSQKLALLWSVPPAIIGLTILAAGTSVPDLLASLKTAREGYGNTAVTNAVGSNVFDVLGNLGLTWLIASVFTGLRNIEVETNNLNGSILLLIASSAALLAVLFAQKFRLGKPVAALLMGAYVLSVVFLSYRALSGG